MSNHLSASAKVYPCSCKHESQDQLHGKGQRVHNPFKNGDNAGYRCTVCKKERTGK